ncbi:MAG: hypothetical protein ABFD96_19345 [Armatimonadia bacterium]
MSQKLTTRELMYAISRALRMRYDSVERRRAGRGWREGSLTLTDCRDYLKAHVKVPRGQGIEADALLQRLLPLWRQRSEPKALWFPAVPLARRLRDYKLKVYTQEIRSRGGETSIRGKVANTYLRIIDQADGLLLLRADGWRHYSNRFGARPAHLVYLCGRDDNGRWAVRVPSTVERVSEALEVLKPAPVRKAEEAGRTVLRQGDVYAVQTTRRYDGAGELPSNHVWDVTTRELRHLDPRAPHACLTVPFPVRFYTQTALRMGRLSSGSRTGRGD